MRECVSPSPDGWMELAYIVVGMGGGSVGCKLPWVAYKPSYVVAWARHGACHACPLGHFMNSARGQVTLYMMAGMTGE